MEQTQSTVYSLELRNQTSYIRQTLTNLQKNDCLTDMTIFVNDSPHFLKCHKFVMIANSAYFRELIMGLEKHNVSGNTVVCVDKVTFRHMDLLLQLIYRGVLHISRDELNDFLEIASRFKIIGFENVGKSNNKQPGQQKRRAKSKNDRSVLNGSMGQNGPKRPCNRSGEQMENPDDVSIERQKDDAAEVSLEGQEHTDKMPDAQQTPVMQDQANTYQEFTLFERNEPLEQNSQSPHQFHFSCNEQSYDSNSGDSRYEHKKPSRILYSPFQLQAALTEVQNGDITKEEAAKKYKVPANTLANMLKLISDQSKRERISNWTCTYGPAMKSALHSLENDMSFAEASRKFNVPNKSLREQFVKNVLSKCQRQQIEQPSSSNLSSYEGTKMPEPVNFIPQGTEANDMNMMQYLPTSNYDINIKSEEAVAIQSNSLSSMEQEALHHMTTSMNESTGHLENILKLESSQEILPSADLKKEESIDLDMLEAGYEIFKDPKKEEIIELDCN